jgi:hypothetical protein
VNFQRLGGNSRDHSDDIALSEDHEGKGFDSIGILVAVPSCPSDSVKNGEPVALHQPMKVIGMTVKDQA